MRSLTKLRSAIIPGNNLVTHRVSLSLSRKSLTGFGIAFFRRVYPVGQQWRRRGEATRKRKERESRREIRTTVECLLGTYRVATDAKDGKRDWQWYEVRKSTVGKRRRRERWWKVCLMCVYMCVREREKERRRRMITGSRGSLNSWRTSDSACITRASISSWYLKCFENPRRINGEKKNN